MIHLIEEPMTTGDPGLDRGQFSEEAAKHHRGIIAYACSLTHDPEIARDLAQDALLAAYKVRERFDPQQNFGNWVRGILRHKWIDQARRNKVAFVDEETLNQIDWQYDQWDPLSENQPHGAVGALRECMQRLSEKQHAVVQRIYFDGFTAEEVADQQNKTSAAIRKQLQRIREQLRTCLQTKSTTEGDRHER